ncbi:MAG: hypothetical protein JWO31_85, partial [Phycisphaerales bacterium]|nr:hypothetical protein [Phycisphaerales bacterium]
LLVFAGAPLVACGVAVGLFPSGPGTYVSAAGFLMAGGLVIGWAFRISARAAAGIKRAADARRERAPRGFDVLPPADRRADP